MYVGLDVHGKQSTFCVLNKHRRHLRPHAIRGPWNTVLSELDRVKKPFAVCFEASTGYGYLHERLSRMARRVVVAHPGQLRLIFRSKQKHDRASVGDGQERVVLCVADALHLSPENVDEAQRLVGSHYDDL